MGWRNFDGSVSQRRPDAIGVVVVVWARLRLNPHPLKTEGAAPSNRFARTWMIDWVAPKPRDLRDDRGYREPLRSTEARCCLFGYQYVGTLRWAKSVSHNQTQVLCFVCRSLFVLGGQSREKPRKSCGPQDYVCELRGGQSHANFVKRSWSNIDGILARRSTGRN